MNNTYTQEELDIMVNEYYSYATHEKQIKVNDKDVNIIWPNCDKQTYNVITYDWVKHHHKIMNYFTNDTANVVLQAGGCCGLYPLLYGQVFKKVITFEPDPFNFYCLSNNCKGSQYIKINAALSDKNGTEMLTIHGIDNVGMHSFADGPNKIGVLTMTIDSLNLDQLSLLQLDIEGHELQALKGAVKTIKKFKSILMIEITSDEEKTIKFIENLGYKIDDVFGFEKNYIFIPTT
jgi:FkbM family methyltransferase